MPRSAAVQIASPRRQPAVRLLAEGARPRALRFFHSPTLAAARRQARLDLISAPRCHCCDSLRTHIHRRIGWTFFIDDDPEQLAQAFDAPERESIKRTLAACILLFGRERTRPTLLH